MSGGIAYVLDERGDFAERRCNRAAVDLEAVPAEDESLLMSLITRHADLTASPRARWVLENWEHMLPKFIKVFPQEYRRTLGRPVASANAAVHEGHAVEVARG
jgi:glutamate synthase domain-containing protein 3